jgi:hypothetical protein
MKDYVFHDVVEQWHRKQAEVAHLSAGEGSTVDRKGRKLRLVLSRVAPNAHL